jgi:hypothetical protein
MVVFLLAKELLDAIPVTVIVAAVLVVIGLESLGVPVIQPAIDIAVGFLEAVWNWFIDAVVDEVNPV